MRIVSLVGFQSINSDYKDSRKGGRKNDTSLFGCFCRSFEHFLSIILLMIHLYYSSEVEWTLVGL